MMGITVYRALLVTAIAWGVLSFGAVYPWGYWVVAAIAAGLGGWSAFRMHAWNDPRTRWLAVALGVTALAIALQIVSLPHALVSTLSPALDAYLGEYQVGYVPSAAEWRPLSLHPAATAIDLVLFIAFALLLVGLTRAIRHVGVDWLASQLMGLGVGLAVLGVVQRTLVSDRARPLVYGFWAPLDGGSPFGPFINRNHFAGWMVMVLPLVIAHSCAIIVESRDASQRGFASRLRWLLSVDGGRLVLVGVSILVMGMALVLTGSRSGIASFAVGVSVIAIFATGRLHSRLARASAVLYLVILLAGAVAWAGLGRTIDRFGLTGQDLSARISVWRDTMRMIADFKGVGVGLGSYDRAMLVYQSGDRNVTYAQAHNDYLQVAAEGGLLVGVPLTILVLLLMRQTLRRLTAGEDERQTQWVRVGAVAGLVGISAQSMVEFSLRLPGTFFLFVVLLAFAIHRPARSPYANRF